MSTPTNDFHFGHHRLSAFVIRRLSNQLEEHGPKLKADPFQMQSSQF